MQGSIQKFILLLLLITGHVAMAQVKFSATVSSSQVSKNEMLQLRLVVENAAEVQKITPPEFKNFVVVSGPNQESGMTSVNGDVKRYIALTYILQPKTAGKFVIGAAIAKADGKEFKSSPVSIEVSNTNAPNSQQNNNASPFGGFNPFDDTPTPPPFNDYILKKGENAADKVSRNMFVKMELDRTNCYVGEPIIATYKLYTRLKSESNLTKTPSFNGFSVIDLMQADNMGYTREKVNGREYNVYILRKAQLYPLQSGNLELDPVEIENNVHFIKEAFANRESSMMNDVFQEFEDASIPPEGVENQKVILKSKPASIVVKPLPDSNAPVGFKGAVGRFSIEASLEKNTFTTDDAGKLNVMVSGEGNLQLVNSPEIEWPKNFEAFDPAITDDITKTTVPVSGKKMISYPFTITMPGNYTIPAIHFSYFDPKQGKYKTDSTQPISFTVTQGTGIKNDSVAVIKKEQAGFLNKFFNNRRWVVSSVAILIILGLLFWLKKDRKKEAQLKIAAQQKTAEEKAAADAIAATIDTTETNYLEQAGNLIHGDNTVFYTELNLALKKYLSQKLQLPIETINKKNIAEQLDKKNIAVDTANQLQQILSDVEMQLYAPFTSEEKKYELYNSAAEIIQLLDTYKN
jgi:hypothetical protein